MEEKENEDLAVSNEPEDLNTPESEEEESALLDYEEELESIRDELPECVPDICQLENNERYRELRLLGLTSKEAYLATRPRDNPIDNRSHLTGAVPKGASAPSGQMSRRELDMARSIFGDLDDNELRRLYKKVTK